MKIVTLSAVLSMVIAFTAFAGDPGYTGTGGRPKIANVNRGSSIETDNRSTGSRALGGEGNKSPSEKTKQGGTNGRLGGTGT